MKKEEIRREFFKLKIKKFTLKKCKNILLAQFGYEVSKRTLQRWNKKLNFEEWDLTDKSKRPKTIHTKITQEIEEKIIKIRNKTGWGENKILNKHHLTKPNPNRKKQVRYIRWQREHPNSLWQMDISDQKIEGRYCFA